MGIPKILTVSHLLLMNEAALFTFNLGSMFFSVKESIFLRNNVTIFPLCLAVQEGGSENNKNHYITRDFTKGKSKLNFHLLNRSG